MTTKTTWETATPAERERFLLASPRSAHGRDMLCRAFLAGASIEELALGLGIAAPAVEAVVRQALSVTLQWQANELRQTAAREDREHRKTHAGEDR